ncbi:MAG TPA: hypothetical protein PLW83_04855 [Deltaproteobacteria bacterium]|nr:hypothetical protein [Deltaproteobacteria bacterium]
MAPGDRETVLSLLEDWRAIVDLQARSVEDDDVETLQELVHKAVAIQTRLDKTLSEVRGLVEDGDVAALIEDLSGRQGMVARALQERCDAVSREMADLAKGRTALDSYRSRRETSHRFMSRRT